MKLYHHPFSSNARKAVMTADLLGVPVELELVDLPKGGQRSPDYRALNPNAKVPVLVDGDFVLWESHAIMLYLAEERPGNALYPADRRARADVNRWLFWCSNHFATAIAMLNFERVVKRMVGGGEPDPAQIQRGETFFKEFAGVLDQHLAKHEWLVGNAMTLADVSMAAALMYEGPAQLPLEPFSNVRRWFGKMKELDAWKKTEPRF